MQIALHNKSCLISVITKCAVGLFDCMHFFFFLRYCHLSLLLPSKILVFHCLTKMPKENGTCKFKGGANILETIYYIYIDGP